jgi:CheY-like chemotaxis protein
MPLPQVTAVNGVHILVLDNDPDSLALTAFVLDSAGAVVTAVDCVTAAQAHFVAHPPQLVVSDLALPGLTGYDFLSWVRVLRPDAGGQVPVLALTTCHNKTPVNRTGVLQSS